MDINVSADIGQNLTGLVTKLAEQIGVTADKVFPWYVKQQVIEGWCMVLIPAAFILVGIIALIPGLIMLCKEDPLKSTRGYAEYPVNVVGTIISISAGFILLCSIVVVSASLSTAISQIKNPEYFATKCFLRDVSNLVPGK